MKTTREINALYNAYYRAALTKGVFEYYMLCESRTKEAEEAAWEKIDAGVRSLLSGSIEDRHRQLRRLEELRNEMIEKMQVLTAYADCFQIYEYVLNRLEQKYQPKELTDEVLFAENLFRQIFSGKDSMVINENIRESIAQLPVRMAKQRYFDLISQSIGLYKGSDKEDLDSYLYLLRTSAMLYRPQGFEQYFTEYGESLEKLKMADYEALGREDYDSLRALLDEATASLIDRTEFYISVQELLNSLTAALTSLTVMEKEIWEQEQVCRTILEQAAEQNFSTEQELSLLEGQQEQAYEQIEKLEAANAGSQKKIFEDDLWNLEKLGKLMSSSTFVSLEKETRGKTVDAALVQAEAERLTAELRQLFEDSSKRVIRAVMAATLQKMPVFFENPEEVKSYIINSLEQCRDVSEKNVSMGLLMELMEIR